MQQGNMKLHAKLSKFHIEHAQNGATHTLQTRYNNNLPKTEVCTLPTSKQHATGPQQENKRHGHDVQVKHDKT